MPSTIPWEMLLDMIRQGKCVLFLGPEIFCQGKQSFHDMLKGYLAVEEDPNILAYYEKDGLFLFPNESAKMETFFRIRDFYRHFDYTDIAKKITEIPFPLVVSVNPDLHLRSAFERSGHAYDYSVFSKNIGPKEIDAPAKKRPLIYHLFGTIESEESLILTHDDLFDFLIAALGNQGLPAMVRKSLKEARLFLFLGFHFDRWYMQLILRLLNPRNENATAIRFAFNDEVKGSLKSFYIDQFRIKFMDLDFREFVGQLYEKCAEQKLTRSQSFAREIFISYAWEEESDNDALKEHLVDQIYTSFESENYNIIRDKVDLQYKGSIVDFMRKIGRGKCVIAIISAKYLTSEYCMYELVEVKRNGNFASRVFPIVLDDAQITVPAKMVHYLSVWDQRIADLQKMVDSISGQQVPAELSDRISRYREIREAFTPLISEIINMNTLTVSLHRKNDFSLLKQFIDKALNQDLSYHE